MPPSTLSAARPARPALVRRPRPSLAARVREGRGAVTAFVLSGGAGLGAMQVGMLRALVARGIVPDLIVGTSVGAINGAWFAGHPTLEGVEQLGAIWRSLRPRDIFPADPRTALLGFLGRRDHLVSPAPLERLVRRHLPYRRLEEAQVPIHVVATDVMAGTEVVLSAGDALGAILASSAIPGIFPPVRHDGRLLMDGGVVANTPLACAVALGADLVYVLRTGCRTSISEPPRTALGAAMVALTVLSEERLLRDVERFGDAVRIELVPPPAMRSASPVDLRGSGQLIEAAAETATRWLRRRDRTPAPLLVAAGGDERPAILPLERTA